MKEGLLLKFRKTNLLFFEVIFSYKMGDRLLSSAGTGRNCVLSMRVPNPGPVLDKNCAPMGPEILSSTGAGVWRKAPMAFPGSSSALDKFQSAIRVLCLRAEKQLAKQKGPCLNLETGPDQFSTLQECLNGPHGQHQMKHYADG